MFVFALSDRLLTYAEPSRLLLWPPALLGAFAETYSDLDLAGPDSYRVLDSMRRALVFRHRLNERWRQMDRDGEGVLC